MSELLKLLKRDVEPFKVLAVPLNQCYQVTIDAGFEDVAQFAELVDYLNNACEGDIAHIKISTPGGALHSILPLMAAMRNTDAHIAMHVESDTASCGTILMMLADEVYINPYTTIMLHSASYGYYNHQANMDAHVKHSTHMLESLMRDVYQYFLSEQEIARLLDGKEIYLTDEDCYDRFKRRDEAILRKLEAANKPPKKPRVSRKKPAVEALPQE